MISFMVIAAPRSGTTWAANWLTTDATLCLHDPLYQYHYSELDAIESGKMLGVSCTGLFHFPAWLNKHPARKVVLHRDQREINNSLEAIGLPRLNDKYLSGLGKIDGVHLDWRDLFDHPKRIYEYLLELPFDAERHGLLRGIEMQPDFEGLTVNAHVGRRLLSELRSM